ncbi:MAG: hypothetical protein B6I26_06330 [Desulfobacteraceae bacterium 4572_130]|nr:MAG: hypothetical protein B6I26_06330 [Desulfobacteraceae bacterium 4572_130]
MQEKKEAGAESKFKFEIKLKQHTPMIHFQHAQTGASLRATELKPKLDKFLKKKCPYLPFGEKGNLDYKVKIITSNIEFKDITPPKQDENGNIKTNSKGEIQREAYPNFFGNIGSNNGNYKKTSFTRSIINLEFFSFEKEIKKAIKENFTEFILKTNFGTRQSKGFGSFYIHPDEENYKKPNLKYKFTVDSTKIKELFYKIELFYKTLRSGINRVNFKSKTTIFYFKSMMFLYAKHIGIQWDKKSIKEAYFTKGLTAQNVKHKKPEKNKKLMKDLLGLSATESWKSYNETIKKEHKNKEIDRFKSPIIFKPLLNKNNGFDVYFYAKKINPDFLGQCFVIKNNSRNDLKLQVPEKFDFDEFLAFALKVDLYSHVENVDTNFHSTKEFKSIKVIYDDINKNLRGAK